MKYFFLLLFPSLLFAKPVIKIGSKNFTESYILAEIIARIVEDTGEAKVSRHLGLGGTGITYQALKSGEIDIYPEYTGTISETILKNSKIRSIPQINEKLVQDNLMVSKAIGFNNTYALAVNVETQKKYNLKNISDLKSASEIEGGFTHEFIKREDGLEALKRFYGINLPHIIGMEHALAYEAISKKQIELIDVYSTDAKIKKYELVLLKDDLSFFPQYHAVLFFHKNFATKYPKTWANLQKQLVGEIDDETMTELNASVELDKKTFKQVAAEFLNKKFVKTSSLPWKKITVLTGEHLKLVFISLALSILIGLPLGVFATKHRFLAQFFLMGSGLLQTIPSLALLCFMIPLVGIGESPAYLALFLYGLLPIVRNTYTGIKQIDGKIMESSQLMGLSYWQKLRLVELPLASPSIMSGIKTSAVINVGTATLAAFIGAGGLGNLIVTGLALNDTRVILQGAVPAALLALGMHLFFELADKIIIPLGIRK